MNLEIIEHDVLDVSWGEETCFEKGHLYIDKDEIVSKLLEIDYLDEVEPDIVHPGDKVRIVNILDILDSRCKEEGDGVIYPGIVGELGIAGIGRTHVLRGLVIAEVGDIKGMQATTSLYKGLLDMSGACTEVTDYSSNHILVLNISAGSTSAATNAMVFKKAAIMVSKYLASKAVGSPPSEVKKYSLDTLNRVSVLPRLGYLYLTETQNDLKETYIYGINSRLFLPYIIHPNEILDGAMVCMSYEYSAGLRNHTYSMVNNPVIEELYVRHGKDLDFGGVIIANAHVQEPLKRMNAMLVAKIAKYQLGLDGIVITKEGGGHPEIDQMYCCQECEKLGVKSSLIMKEGKSSKYAMTVVYYADEADLVTSIGIQEETLKLPELERVIGVNKQECEKPDMLRAEREVPYGIIPGALSGVGHNRNGGMDF